jgi:DNA-binding response OmpR family regulator
MPRQHHLLLVHDDAAQAYAQARLLSRHGFRTSVALSEAAALAAQENDPADAVILDQGAPDLSGATLATKFRARWPDLIIAAIVGSDAVKVCDVTLVKPVDPEVLVENLRRLLARLAVLSA